MHEIVTLQFGNQSNYIGTHFWNAQESYFTYSTDGESPVDHDIHFRPGIGADGSETFTPRTVIYDVKENFGTLREVNALYEIQEQSQAPPGVWRGSPILRQQPTIPLHPYQVELDAGSIPSPIAAPSVRFWSDFNRVYYHPRSMVQLTLPTSHLPPSEGQIAPLDQWDIGEELFKSEDREHDLLDRDLRLFVEECDQMQGFQVFSSVDDAWAGFSSRYVERIRDEYGRKSIWVWGAEDQNERASREKRRHQAVNLARSYSLLSTQASLYIPMTNDAVDAPPSYLSHPLDFRWQTSALQATALESATLPTRLRAHADTTRGLMSDIEPTFINEVKRNVLELSMNVSKPSDGAPMVNGTSGHDFRMTNGYDHDELPAEPEKLDISLFRRTLGIAAQNRSAAHRQHAFAQTITTRGLAMPEPEVAERTSPYAPIIQNFASNLLAPRVSSFPPIFRLPGMDDHASVSVKAALTASSAVAEKMRALADFVRRSVGVEEREELGADLLAKAEEYIDGWEDVDDSSDDE